MLYSIAWTIPFVAVMQLNPIDTQSAISVGLMITIIGAASWLSRVLTRGEEQMKGINEKLGRLVALPEQFAVLKHEVETVRQHISTLEGDVNNLWTAVRQTSGDRDLLDRTRRERGPRATGGD